MLRGGEEDSNGLVQWTNPALGFLAVLKNGFSKSIFDLRARSNPSPCTTLMLKLKFVPESEEFAAAAKSYTDIWEKDGQRIVKAIETETHLDFKEELIKVKVFEGASQSHPMKLRASYNDETKKATLVHELLHRISADYMLPVPEQAEDPSLGFHKQINLVLYEIWIKLLGKEGADRQVAVESARTPMYKTAWEWTLSLSKEERAQKFAKLSNKQHSDIV